MLRRFDENGNGMIDPSEGQGRASFFLQRIASEIPKLDLSRPIPIDKLANAMDKLRQKREAEAQSGGGDRGGSTSRGGSSASATIEPLVPGFGLEEELAVPPGFGAEGELFTVKVTDADKREADERFRRYDSNRDGVLDRGEIARGRWSDDPMAYDRNNDGKLTPSEMAVRYARRRIAEEGSSSSGGSSSRSSSSSSSGDPRMDAMVKMVFDRYDSNKNGVFEKDEWSNFRSPPDEADKNRDRKITKTEITTWMASRFGGGGRGGDRGGRGGGGPPGFAGGGGSGGSFYSSRDSGSGSGSTSDNSDNPRSYRVKSAIERLPDGLPEWFARNDANSDAQVAMSEYTASWSAATVKDFAQFDLNSDGVITAAEALRAANNGAVRGASVSSPTTVATTRAASPSTSTSATSTPATSTPASSTSATTKKKPTTLEQRYLDYYGKMLKKYDKNADGALVASEWQLMSKDPSAADSNGDARVTVEELMAWSRKK